MTDSLQKYHLPKVCKFCGQAAGYAPIEKLNRYGIDVYFCHSCQAEFSFFKSGRPSATSIYTKINDKMYRWTITGGGNARITLVNNPGVPGVTFNYNLEVVKSFPNTGPIPHITPQNIQEKLKTILLFL